MSYRCHGCHKYHLRHDKHIFKIVEMKSVEDDTLSYRLRTLWYTFRCFKNEISKKTLKAIASSKFHYVAKSCQLCAANFVNNYYYKIEEYKKNSVLKEFCICQDCFESMAGPNYFELMDSQLVIWQKLF